MAEYIERGALYEALTAAAVNDKFKSLGTWAKAICVLHDLPAADVALVVHGRWIEQEKYTFGVMYDCSICGDRILDNGHSWNYCPNCGARMDGYENG